MNRRLKLLPSSALALMAAGVSTAHAQSAPAQVGPTMYALGPDAKSHAVQVDGSGAMVVDASGSSTLPPAAQFGPTMYALGPDGHGHPLLVDSNGALIVSGNGGISSGGSAISWQGTYSNTTNYALNNAVTYNGSSYLSLASNNQGNTPSSGSAWWGLLALAGTNGTNGTPGAAGTNGQGFNFRGAWAASTTYAAYDVVTNAGSAYVVTAAFTSASSFSTTNLTLLASAGAQGPAGPAPSGTGIVVTNGSVPAIGSGDCTANAAGNISCTKTGGTLFAPSATTDATNAANISSGTLGAARLPAATTSAQGAVVMPTGSSGNTLAKSASVDTTNAANISSGYLPPARLCTDPGNPYYYYDPHTGLCGALASVPAISSAVAITGGTMSGVTITNSPISGATGSFTTLANSGQRTSTAASGANTPALLDTGTLFTGGTGTTNTPHWYINQGSTAPTTFSSSGTLLGFNLANGSTATIFDVHVNGSASVASLDFSGKLIVSKVYASLMYAPSLINSSVTLAVASSTTGTTTINSALQANQLVTPAEVVSYSATPTFSATTEVSEMVLTGNVTSSTLATGTNGAHKRLRLCMASAYTVTLPTNVTAPTATLATGCNTISLEYTTLSGYAGWHATSSWVTGS